MLPILKWTGGKRKLLNSILPILPKDINKYIEPFIGGGALFFNLEKNNSYISDVNEELINFYIQIASNPIEVLELANSYINSLEEYNKIRGLDRNKIVWDSLSHIERAARFLYLNRAAYSGMWRVNKNNQMNVPFGKYSSLTIPSKEEILKASELLKSTTIKCSDYSEVLTFAKSKDLVYLDPPYIPISDTSSFTSYTKDGFNNKDHQKLLEFCDELSIQDVNWALSNSYSEITLDLYSDYNIYLLDTKRSISTRWSKNSSVDNIKEILVTNF